jgi:hypothetical protein
LNSDQFQQLFAVVRTQKDEETCVNNAQSSIAEVQDERLKLMFELDDSDPLQSRAARRSCAGQPRNLPGAVAY